MPSTASPPWTQTQAEDLGCAPTSSSTLVESQSRGLENRLKLQ